MLGMLPPGTVPIMANRAVTREVELAGSFRFAGEDFRTAVMMLSAGLDVSPLLTGRIPLADSVRAFETKAKASSKSVDFKIYPDAGHAFASSLDPKVFRTEDARDADARTEKFLEKRLKAK